MLHDLTNITSKPVCGASSIFWNPPQQQQLKSLFPEATILLLYRVF